MSIECLHTSASALRQCRVTDFVICKRRLPDLRSLSIKGRDLARARFAVRLDIGRDLLRRAKHSLALDELSGLGVHDSILQRFRWLLQLPRRPLIERNRRPSVSRIVILQVRSIRREARLVAARQLGTDEPLSATDRKLRVFVFVINQRFESLAGTFGIYKFEVTRPYLTPDCIQSINVV